jgi:hypothetical protein
VNLKGRVERVSAAAPRPPAVVEPYGPEWIDRGDTLLETMPDEQAEGILRDLQAPVLSRRARAFTAAVARGLTFAEGEQLST